MRLSIPGLVCFGCSGEAVFIARIGNLVDVGQCGGVYCRAAVARYALGLGTEAMEPVVERPYVAPTGVCEIA